MDMDKELAELLIQEAQKVHEHHVELNKALADTAKMLGAFRRALLHEGFSTRGAEDMARDYYSALIGWGGSGSEDE